MSMIYIPGSGEGTRIGVTSAPKVDPFTLPRIDLPRVDAPPFDFRLMAHDIQGWTGWSDRTLAEAIGTTHTTIAALRSGTTNVGSRNPEYLLALQDAYDVISRVTLIAGHDRARTAAALEGNYQGRSARSYLSTREARLAYIAAIRNLVPRSQTRLLTGSRPAIPGEGVADYLSED